MTESEYNINVTVPAWALALALDAYQQVIHRMPYEKASQRTWVLPDKYKNVIGDDRVDGRTSLPTVSHIRAAKELVRALDRARLCSPEETSP